MGIDVHVLDFLLRNRKHVAGKVLMLGRQGIHIQPETAHYETATKVLQKYDPDADPSTLLRPGHADDFLRYLGGQEISAMDNSAYEGADIIHDLNRPVPVQALRALRHHL